MSTGNNMNDLGDQIRETVDRAINSGDFTDLSRAIGDAVNGTIDLVKANIRSNMQQTDIPTYQGTGTHMKRTATGWTVTHTTTNSSSQKWTTGPNYNRDTAPSMPAFYVQNPSKAIGITLMVTGLALLVVFGSMTILLLCVFLIEGMALGGMITSLIFTLFSLFLMGTGLKKLKLINRFKSYTKQIGSQLNVPIKAIADKENRSVDKVTGDLLQMINKKMFLEAHVDEDDKVLILSNDAYDTYKEAKYDFNARMEKQRKEMEKITPEVRKLLEDGNNYIGKIHHYNDEIPGEPITSKLNEMESIVTQIFAVVKKHPEVASDLNQMMDYYLPTTIKLLDTYREMDRQETQGSNITSTKAEIEAAIDTLNLAFHNLLNDLFEDKAWDISSDISVLNTKLAQEGLTRGGLSPEK